MSKPLLFALNPHPLAGPLCQAITGEAGRFSARTFPDGESFLQIHTNVAGRQCIVLADLSHPNEKYLPLLFMAETLRELGASTVGLVAPYLSYMRQDRRFADGEAVTSGIFARSLSQHVDWLVTVDPHLHRYHSLDEIYSIPSQVVQGAPALAGWLKNQQELFLVGPDAESEQWVSGIAEISGHPFIIGEKLRRGDNDVRVSLPDIGRLLGKTAVIIDDVISSGHTILECAKALQLEGVANIHCVAVHGIFANESDKLIISAGVSHLVTTNTVNHPSNRIDITPQLYGAVLKMLGL